MGVLNVTPDSFSDGGEFFDPENAIARGVQIATEGADILDVGGESTRPGSESISIGEELRRVIPVIEGLRGKIDIPISIDTSKVEVASAAIDAGAVMVNDVTGGRDPAMMSLVAERSVAFVIMHMQGVPRTMQIEPHYEDVVNEVGVFFRQQYDRALECDIDPMTIAFDPGIGFGKALDHNLELLRNLESLRMADRPMVVGVSRKSFLSKIANGASVEDRLALTIALTAALRARGGDVFRVHDVRENVSALRAADALLER